MKLSLPQNQNGRVLSVVIPVVALVLILFNPADPRRKGPDQLSHTLTQIHTPNSTDTQMVLYKKVYDSLERIIYWKKQRLNPVGSSLNISSLGINRVDECDSCIDINEKSTRRKYFISLNGFALKPNANFLIEGNDFIIDRFVADKKTEFGEFGHREQQKTGVRLADPQHDNKGLTLLIPVSKSSFRWIEIAMYILFALAVVAAIWLFLRLPVQVLVNIANGKPFVKQNIKYLNRIGWGITGTCLLLAIMPWIIQLVLSSKIPGDIYYPFWSSLFDYRWGILLGLAVLIIARAFKQGYQLQQEQDLTI